MLRFSLLLAWPYLPDAIPAQTATKVVFGKYYQVTDKGIDNSDNAFFLYKPPANLNPSLKPSGKVPVVFQVIGNSWVKLDNGGEYHGPFKKMTPAIGNYISNGAAFISMPYRATDVRYFYDDGGQRKAEELIHVDADGRLTLDKTGKTMGDYKCRMCWQELITKCIYDAVQGLEHLLAHADEFGIDVHRIMFLSASAGTSIVSYLTYVYHEWHQARFTPVGMIIGSPQFDVPVYCALDHAWKVYMDFASPDLKASELFDIGWCQHFVANAMCGNQAHQVAAFKTGIKHEENCNTTWQQQAEKVCSQASFQTLTVGQLHASQKWVKDDPEVGPGMEKLWYSSRNMEKHHPKPFHLMAHSHDNFFIHESVYVLAFAKKADEIGINYTTYFQHYPGITPKDLGFPLWGKLGPFDPKQIYYRSSIEWRGLYQKVHDTYPGSIDEHFLFVCYVLGLKSCSPSDSISPALLL